ncbi:tight adherence protein C [Caldicellulosiruptor bescii]|uniref:Type II secretion system protein n=2 Tax=Caldicellulosiruptor bescii TaxID=31899 RepID=B9MNI8_CALBD|nr:type II secretion system F family protein [Caldicellulosiruptor bescii]ACM61519.1 type II secretion system protein [Caldicellulosiruptor bescii DSM 6725]PBC88669.1 tight adherence protein C [Caldicellulosiruptor bescii]PBC91850.1 tight adherence protein C [Caldicellulosiruptor bescii]PBD02739.1 tight adherence protein C [Caldicellulosiruptor bescii]PBD07644.1 tight adherence protein C [Caldicellulosiruptor bescii]
MKITLKPLKIKKYVKRFEKNQKAKDIIEKLDRQIKTVFGVDVEIQSLKRTLFGFAVQDVYDFISIVFTFFLISCLLFALYTRISILFGLIFLPSVTAMPIAVLSIRTKKFKNQFKQDLLDTIETMIQGFKCGLVVEQVLEYISESQENLVTPFIREINLRLLAGQSLKEASLKVSQKTLCSEFEKMCRIFNLRSVTISHISEALSMLAQNIYEEQKTEIETLADKLNVRFTLIMLVGYVIPFLILVTYPLVMMMTKYSFFGGS